MTKSETDLSLGKLITRGGIYHSVPGDSVQTVLEFLAAKIPAPKNISSQEFIRAILEREAFMSTGIGRGIAIPHPRNPLIEQPEEQFAALAFLEHPVDWKAPDGKAVDTLFIVAAASAKSHLQILSAISYFCQQQTFKELIEKRASQEELLQYINKAEQNWL